MNSTDMAALRRMVCAIESNNPHGTPQANYEDEHNQAFTLGHAGADSAFPRGIARNALHEVCAENPAAYISATGFALALAARAARTQSVIWIEEEAAEHEYGGLYPPGLSSFGLNPQRLLLIRCPGAQDVLKAANDGLHIRQGDRGSHLIAAIVASVTGKAKCLDLTASRRLLLAAQTAHVPVILLSSHRMAMQSAAVSRWAIAAAPSRSSGARAPGRPSYSATLERNRHGTCGRWTMEWNNEDLCFEPAEEPGRLPVHGPVVSFSAHRQNTPRRSA